MKPTTSHADANNLDLLLFRYVEGDLSAGQVRELETRLASDAVLRDELSFWKESFVEPDMYDTASLEKALLVPAEPRQAGSYFGTWVLMMTLVVSLFRTVPAGIESEMILAAANGTADITGEAGNKAGDMKETAFRKSTATIPVPVREEKMPERIQPEGYLFRSVIPEIESRPLEKVTSAVRVPLAGIEVQKIKRKPIAATRTLTRRQQREILKMKEKARQQRQADQFLKGNVPYVVPLNSENF